MLLLNPARLEARRLAARGPLAPLFDSLVAELEPLVGRAPYVPEAKALLTRAGGRCENDGTQLEFDPFAPHEHRCPTCLAIHKGEVHHRAWVTLYQLWLAERAVHAALFFLLRGDERHGALARDILGGYAERYLRYANRDNVLGPTRLFFSTYLESVWLLQLCVAADLMRAAGDADIANTVCERIAEPSAELIAGYDEGMSNRQVWHNAALMAAALLGNDAARFDRRIGVVSGLEAHLTRALLPDGTWYEGENYHQFALRGLWYAVAMCDARGLALPAALDERFQRAFEAPYRTALPDLTLPSRKDSQYAVSLRQWRFAELTELGYARGQSSLLGGALARIYGESALERSTGRARSTADIERNGPACRLTRADLGWRALLHACEALPAYRGYAPRSALLEGQGLAVFRRDHDAYVALDYGQSGGGHGHPDRLNLLLCEGPTRWLDDLGTGSYLDASLHWYRSTLAHNAPLVNGRSQPFADGSLLAYDEREGMGWAAAEFSFEGVQLTRTVVVAPDYLVDELRWFAAEPVRVDLPWHLDAQPVDVELTDASLDASGRQEDGFPFLHDTKRVRLPAGAPLELRADRDGRTLRAVLTCDRDAEAWAASAPGQPPLIRRGFHMMGATAADGVFRCVLAWSPEISSILMEGSRVTVIRGETERHVHQRLDAGWHVDLFAGGARSSIDLGGARPPAPRGDSPSASPRSRGAPARVARSEFGDAWWTDLREEARRMLASYALSESHYRRSEESWSEAGSPMATIGVGATENALVVFVLVRAGDLHFAPRDATNPNDNEHPDTTAAGVQLYLRTPDGANAWMLIPELERRDVRVRQIAGWGEAPAPRARWRPVSGGYEIRADFPLRESAGKEYPVELDVIVNETTAGREHRRGQLVLSGARGEFVYLRGDRHDADRLLPMVIVP